MRLLFGTKPLKDDSGVLIFKYWRGTYYIMVMLSVLLVFGVIYDPPTKLEDIAIAIFLIGSALFMSMQSCKYYLVLSENSIIRYSPWPWHKRNIFELNEITEVEIKYRMNLSIKMSNGYELEIPILLMGAFQLLHYVINNSSAIVGKEARTIIDYYSQ
ncbi:MAG: hypothetical protein ABGX72_03670 [Methyloprofundus sp.]